MKKLPPFAKPLSDLIAKGARPDNFVNVYIGLKAYQWGSHYKALAKERVIVVPPWVSPKEYYYPVQQCEVLVFDTSYESADLEYVKELVSELLQCGCESRIAYLPFACPYIIFKKEL